MPEADVDHIYNYPKGYIEDILKSVKTIAMVGASGDKTKFSYGVLRVLHETGYEMSVSYTHLTLPTTPYV